MTNAAPRPQVGRRFRICLSLRADRVKSLCRCGPDRTSTAAIVMAWQALRRCSDSGPPATALVRHVRPMPPWTAGRRTRVRSSRQVDATPVASAPDASNGGPPVQISNLRQPRGWAYCASSPHPAMLDFMSLAPAPDYVSCCGRQHVDSVRSHVTWLIGRYPCATVARVPLHVES